MGILRSPQRMRPLRASLCRKVQRVWRKSNPRGARQRTTGRHRKRAATARRTPPAAGALPRRPSRGFAGGDDHRKRRRQAKGRLATRGPGRQPPERRVFMQSPRSYNTDQPAGRTTRTASRYAADVPAPPPRQRRREAPANPTTHYCADDVALTRVRSSLRPPWRPARRGVASAPAAPASHLLGLAAGPGAAG